MILMIIMKIRKYNKLRRQTRKNLSHINDLEQKAFQDWLSSISSSKRTHQTDLPSSQLPDKMSHINRLIAQLFIILDTCSIVSFRTEFMQYVTTLRKNFSFVNCPIKIIICLPVLEELDKCNRPASRRGKSNSAHKDVKEDIKRQQVLIEKANLQSAGNGNNVTTSRLPTDKTADLRDICQLIRGQQPFGGSTEPPRMFMRFLEEEIRDGQVILGELDPFKTIRLTPEESSFEIVNKDDRILECCLRTRAFIRSQEHHPETRVLLVSEDNIFKSKATTYGIVSYRWSEFTRKYKNFGHQNYIASPVPLWSSNCMAASQHLPPSRRTIATGQSDHNRLKTGTASNSTTSTDDVAPTTSEASSDGRIHRIGRTRLRKITTSHGLKRIQQWLTGGPVAVKTETDAAEDAACSTAVKEGTEAANNETKESDISIVKEVINLN